MSTDVDIVRGILTDILNKLQSLQANQVLLAQHVDQGTGLLDAANDKTKILAEIEPQYSTLRKQIEGLAL